MKKDLLNINDLKLPDIKNIIDKAYFYKKLYDASMEPEKCLSGKKVALIFEKPSLRTKISFEVACSSLGAQPIYLSSNQILSSGQNEKGRESVSDIAKNLERFCDLIVSRVYAHSELAKMANSTDNTIINALCDNYHPTQALADLMAMIWHKGEGKHKVVFIGDGNNVATSLMHISILKGYDFSIASPLGYEISKKEQEKAFENAAISGSNIEFLKDPGLAVKDADFVYTDTYVSMGQEAEKQKRLKEFSGFQVDLNLLKLAKEDVLFMHCLPAHRGEEVTDEVMDSYNSIVFDQAECKLHIAKALLDIYLNN